jgi:hypothetical protein
MKRLVTLLIVLLATVVPMGCGSSNPVSTNSVSTSSASIAGGTYTRTDQYDTVTLVFSQDNTMKMFTLSSIERGRSPSEFPYQASGNTVSIFSTAGGSSMKLTIRDNGDTLVDTTDGDVYTRQK